jgi:hypothetical protein
LVRKHGSANKENGPMLSHRCHSFRTRVEREDEGWILLYGTAAFVFMKIEKDTEPCKTGMKGEWSLRMTHSDMDVHECDASKAKWIDGPLAHKKNCATKFEFI